MLEVSADSQLLVGFDTAPRQCSRASVRQATFVNSQILRFERHRLCGETGGADRNSPAFSCLDYRARSNGVNVTGLLTVTVIIFSTFAWKRPCV